MFSIKKDSVVVKPENSLIVSLCKVLIGFFYLREIKTGINTIMLQLDLKIAKVTFLSD